VFGARRSKKNATAKEEPSERFVSTSTPGEEAGQAGESADTSLERKITKNHHATATTTVLS